MKVIHFPIGLHCSIPLTKVPAMGTKYLVLEHECFGWVNTWNKKYVQLHTPFMWFALNILEPNCILWLWATTGKTGHWHKLHTSSPDNVVCMVIGIKDGSWLIRSLYDNECLLYLQSLLLSVINLKCYNWILNFSQSLIFVLFIINLLLFTGWARTPV